GRTLPFTPRIFGALRIADAQTLGPLLARTPPNSDYFPALDLGAERARFEQRTAQGFLQLHQDRFGIAAVGAPRVEPPPSALVPLPRVPRVRSLLWIARLRSALAGALPSGTAAE